MPRASLDHTGDQQEPGRLAQPGLRLAQAPRRRQPGEHSALAVSAVATRPEADLDPGQRAAEHSAGGGLIVATKAGGGVMSFAVNEPVGEQTVEPGPDAPPTATSLLLTSWHA